MAIIVEEEKKPVNWIFVLTVAFIILALFVAAYYVFFKKPELIEVIVPKELETIKDLSQARIDPRIIVDSSGFKSLRNYSEPLEVPPKGRLNPFKPL